jgi:outer membrane protein OmpA-like peptidoglycan-associated protein
MLRSARWTAVLAALACSASASAWQDDLSKPGPDSPEMDAKARAALPNAEIRPITGEIRRIEGLQTVISGAVISLEAVQRGLQQGGLEVRSVNGGLEVMLPGDVLFDFDKATIRANAVPILEKVAAAARQTGNRPIRVEGHTDAVGQPAYNQKLSQARAQSVVQWLVKGGIPTARLSAQGFGATRPVAPNKTPDGKDDPAGRQNNRRVTVTFQG